MNGRTASLVRNANGQKIQVFPKTVIDQVYSSDGEPLVDILKKLELARPGGILVTDVMLNQDNHLIIKYNDNSSSDLGPIASNGNRGAMIYIGGDLMKPADVTSGNYAPAITPTAYETNITEAFIGDIYFSIYPNENGDDTMYISQCALGGDPSTALWAYSGQKLTALRGREGPPGPSGGGDGNPSVILQPGMFMLQINDNGELVVISSDEDSQPSMYIDPSSGELVYNFT